MATSTSFLPDSPPRFRRRLSTISGASGLRDRYNYGTIIHNRVFIGGLHSSVTEADLEQKFAHFGKISDIKIIKKPEMEKGYAFITFEMQQDASKLLEHSGSRINIKGLDSKIGPAIRKPSTNENNSCSPTSGFPGLMDSPEIVLKPLITPKRNRLNSSPGESEEARTCSSSSSSLTPIPVPMPGYNKVDTSESQAIFSQSQSCSQSQMGGYVTSQMLQQLTNQKLQQELMIAQLLQASSFNINPLLLHACYNHHQQQTIVQPSPQPQVPPPPLFITPPPSSPNLNSNSSVNKEAPLAFNYPAVSPSLFSPDYNTQHFNTPVAANSKDASGSNLAFQYPAVSQVFANMHNFNGGNILGLSEPPQMTTDQASSIPSYVNSVLSEIASQESIGHQVGMVGMAASGSPLSTPYPEPPQGQFQHQSPLLPGQHRCSFSFTIEPNSSPE